MTRIAVLSDPHANLAALEAVMKQLSTQDVDQMICMGDVVGYGPQPQECVDLIRKHEIVTTMGNHEQGLINIHYSQRFNQPAKDSLMRTREMITEETYQWLVTRPKAVVKYGCRFVHGAPPDSVNEYIWQWEQDMDQIFSRFHEEVCFVGHTHDLMRFQMDGDGTTRKHSLAEGSILLSPESRHIVNVGSVGQPRDGDNRAKYGVFDTDSRELTMHFAPYDIEKTATLIRKRGFHRAFADRLW